MKKVILVLSLLSGALTFAHADSVCTDWGTFNVCLPVTTGVDGAFGYDFRGHKSQGLAETGVANWRVGNLALLVFKVGGITTENGKGAPFAGVDYELRGVANPIPGFTSIHPGVYGGKDFHTNEWFYGIKASMDIFK